MRRTQIVERARTGVLLCVTTGLMHVGCGGPVPDDPEGNGPSEQTSELIGGTVLAPGAPWGGAVKLLLLDSTHNVWIRCSGQIISPHEILTAAHCVQAALNGPDSGTIGFGAARQLSATTWVTVGSGRATVTFNPFHLTTTTPQWDIGLLSSSSQWINISNADIAPIATTAPSQSMWVLGFGPPDSQARGGIVSATYNGNYYSTLTTVPQVCSGDSGGPLKALFGNEVYGVTSQSRNLSCTGGSAFAATKNSWAWARNVMTAWGRRCVVSNALLYCS
jgi:hypothetical protein